MIKIRTSAYLLVGSYVLIVLLMFTWPFSVSEYNWKLHSIRAFAAQSVPYSWIFNALWVGLGIGIVWAGRSVMYGYWFPRAILGILGLTLIFSAFFSMAPIQPGVDYNIKEAELHDIFRHLANHSFILLSIAITFVLKDKKDIKIGWGITGLSSVLILILWFSNSFQGMAQNAFILISFGWLIYLFGITED